MIQVNKGKVHIEGDSLILAGEILVLIESLTEMLEHKPEYTRTMFESRPEIITNFCKVWVNQHVIRACRSADRL